MQTHSCVHTHTVIKWEMKDGLSLQDKTVTFNLDHNPVCFYWRPESTCPLVLWQFSKKWSPKTNQSLVTDLTDLHKVTQLCLNWVNMLSKYMALTYMILYVLKYKPLHFTQTLSLQGQWILLLCREVSTGQIEHIVITAYPWYCTFSNRACSWCCFMVWATSPVPLSKRKYYYQWLILFLFFPWWDELWRQSNC